MMSCECQGEKVASITALVIYLCRHGWTPNNLDHIHLSRTSAYERRDHIVRIKDDLGVVIPYDLEMKPEEITDLCQTGRLADALRSTVGTSEFVALTKQLPFVRRPRPSRSR